MIKISRVINGEQLEFQLTDSEIREVWRQDEIQWAKDILANYEDMIIDYGTIMSDDEQLVAYAQLLNEKNLEDNGDREVAAIEELFAVTYN